MQPINHPSFGYGAPVIDGSEKFMRELWQNGPRMEFENLIEMGAEAWAKIWWDQIGDEVDFTLSDLILEAEDWLASDDAKEMQS